MVSQPQYLLFCDTHVPKHPSALDTGETLGRWHFVLDRLDLPQRLEATDCETAIHPDRLALLSVVRGLEALDEPSRVNLVTTSRYVSRGLKYGLASWRASDYRWEHFGVQRPVRNADLWQRIDRAMGYHGVSCRLIQSEVASYAAVESEQEPAIDGQDSLAVREQRPASTEPFGATQNGRSGLFSASTSEHRLQQLDLYFSWFMLRNWWEMAWSWFKWWRRRNQPRPAIFGM